MKAGILILVYLARDTIYRWGMRLSSPISRILVVFFLSLCGLIFLSSYVLSLKVVQNRINQSGGNLIVLWEIINGDRTAQYGTEHDILPPSTSGADIFLFHEAFMSAKVDGSFQSIVAYPPCLEDQMTGDLQGETPAPLRVLPGTPCNTVRPTQLVLDNHNLQAATIPEERASFLRRLYPNGAVFIPMGSMPQLWQNGFMQRRIIRVDEVTEENLQRWEDMLNLLAKLDGRKFSIISSANLLRDLRNLEGAQQEFRLGISLGISVIICFLLTSISTLEYRQNEYVYALIGSFGISRVILFGTFVVENTVLVIIGFAAALSCLQFSLPFITHIIFRSPGTMLTIGELGEDIRIFAFAFIVCIAVSSLPILGAVRRPIGNVLK